MSLEVLFLDGPADGARHSYPHLDLALPRLFLFDYRTGRPGAAYGRLDDRPAPDGTWRYRLLDPITPDHPGG